MHLVAGTPGTEWEVVGTNGRLVYARNGYKCRAFVLEGSCLVTCDLVGARLWGSTDFRFVTTDSERAVLDTIASLPIQNPIRRVSHALLRLYLPRVKSIQGVNDICVQYNNRVGFVVDFTQTTITAQFEDKTMYFCGNSSADALFGAYGPAKYKLVMGPDTRNLMALVRSGPMRQFLSVFL